MSQATSSPRRRVYLVRRLVAAWIDGTVYYGAALVAITVGELVVGLRLALEPTFAFVAAILGASLLARDGATPGKILCGLRVERGDGTTFDVRRAFLREAVGKWGLALGVPFAVARWIVGAGWIPSVYDLLLAIAACGAWAVVAGATRRTPHDALARTRIVATTRDRATRRRALIVIAAALTIAAATTGATYAARGWIPAPVALYRDPRPIGGYVSYLERTSETPVDYMMRLFDRFDVVVLGENYHPEMTQWNFIGDLVSDPRFAARVGNVFTEYGFVEDQPALDRLLGTPDLSTQELQRRVVSLERNIADGENTGWDNTNFYRYLLRLYQLDATLGSARRVRHFFTDRDPTWIATTKDQAAESARRVVDRDRRMARTVIDELAAQRAEGNARPKALVIMNFRHAFAPVELWGEPMDNAARYLFEAFPERTANVLLGPYAIPFSYAPLQRGRWDAAWDEIGNRSVGFDLAGSPFGDDPFDMYPLPGLQARYRYRDVFTGMVLVTPLRDQFLERGIPGYIDGFETELVRRAGLVSDAAREEARDQIEWYRAGMPGRIAPHPTFAFQTRLSLLVFALFSIGAVWAALAFLIRRGAGARSGSVV